MTARLYSNRRALLLIHLATLLWASNIALGRALRAQVGPITLTAARFSLAALLFGLLLVWQNSRRKPGSDRDRLIPRTGREWIWLVGMAVTGVFGFPVLLYLALQYTTASHAALINGLAPLMTVFLAGLLLRERITQAALLGGLLSVVGVAFIISGGSFQALMALEFNRGDLIVLADAALWGLYSVFTRLATRARSSIQVTALSIWLALPLLAPAAVLEARSAPPDLSLPVILAVLYIAVFPSVIGFLAWNEGVRRIGPNGAMAFYNMLPVYGALLGFLILGETLTWVHVVGGGLVIGGGLVVFRK